MSVNDLEHVIPRFFQIIVYMVLLGKSIVSE